MDADRDFPPTPHTRHEPEDVYVVGPKGHVKHLLLTPWQRNEGWLSCTWARDDAGTITKLVEVDLSAEMRAKGAEMLTADEYEAAMAVKWGKPTGIDKIDSRRG